MVNQLKCMSLKLITIPLRTYFIAGLKDFKAANDLLHLSKFIYDFENEKHLVVHPTDKIVKLVLIDIKLLKSCICVDSSDYYAVIKIYF